jgi:hypothetical protein
MTAVLEVEVFKGLIDVTFLIDLNSIIGSLNLNTKNVMSITKIFAINLSVQVILNRLLVNIFLVQRSLCRQHRDKNCSSVE